MKKRGIKLIAGLVTAGMLAVTGFVAAQAIGGITTTETIEYEVEKNDAVGYYVSPIFTPRSDDTGYPYLSGFEKSLPKGTRYGRINMKNYNLPVLVVYPTDSNVYAKLYTEKSGRNVRCIGEIYSSFGFKINNGVIYTIYRTDQDWRYISFYVSSDGNGYVVKDYIDTTRNGSNAYIYGFSNHDGYGYAHYINGYDDGDAVLDKFIDTYNDGKWLREFCKTR